MRPLYHPHPDEMTVQGVLYALSDPVRVQIFAQLLSQRFHKAAQRLSLDRPWRELDCTLFIPPSANGQGSLF